MTLVKICGIMSAEEGEAALAAGADWLGFVLWPGSRRAISVETARLAIAALRAGPRSFSAVGVFVNPSADDAARAAHACGLDYVQLSGDEPRELVQAIDAPTIKAIHVRQGDEERVARVVEENQAGATRYLLDAHVEGQWGGTGRPFRWEALRAVGGGCLVAGGLDPTNVAAALATLRPFGVDVSSGVERPGGGKDPERMKSFMDEVKNYDRARDLRPA